jgi:hypothetical protein
MSVILQNMHSANLSHDRRLHLNAERGPHLLEDHVVRKREFWAIDDCFSVQCACDHSVHVFPSDQSG